jgi:hypothetical protein
MAEKVKCEKELDEFIKKTTEWIDRQKEMLEVARPTPEQVEEVTKIYTEVIKKGKEFATCEIAGSSS